MRRHVRKQVKLFLLGILALALVMAFTLFKGTGRLQRAEELPLETNVYTQPHPEIPLRETEMPAQEELPVSEEPLPAPEPDSRQIVLTAASGTFMYDGKEHTVSGISPMEFTIAEQPYTVEGIGASMTALDAGTYSVDIAGIPLIRDSAGNDVTDTFEIILRSGTLTILKRSLVLTSASGTKEYDGTPLVNASVTAGGDGFAPGEGAVYTVTGTQTVTGSGDNVFSYTFNQNTKKDNYAVTVNTGKLTVTGRSAALAVTLKARSMEVTYDGSAHTVQGFDTLEFALSGRHYHVRGVSASVTGVSAGVYDNVIAGTPTVFDENENDVTGQFAINMVSGKLVIHRRNVILTSPDAEKAYDGSPLTAVDVTAGGEGFAEGEGADYSVSGSAVLPGTSANTFSYALYANTDPANYNIETVQGTLRVSGQETGHHITLKPNSAEYMYDGETHIVQDFETREFMIGGNMYRVDNVSAYAEGRDAGVYNVIIEGTPVVYDSEGNDASAQFTIDVSPGTLRINRRTVLLTSASVTKEYDGFALTDGNAAVSGDGFARGEGAFFSVYGSQTIPGSSSNLFTYGLNENTSAQNYEIDTDAGILAVTSRSRPLALTLQANGGSFLYDGREHSVSGIVRDTFTVNGKRFTVENVRASVIGIRAANYASSIEGTPLIRDENGNDVTSQFSLYLKSGTMTIQKRRVILTSASASRDYDGSALTSSRIVISGDGFAANEGAEYRVTGTQTVIGSSANAFSYTLAEGTSTDNYEIETVPGILRVLPKDEAYHIHVSAENAVFLYDGTVHSVSGLIQDTFTAEGKTYTLEGLQASAEGVHAGVYPSIITGTPVIRDSEGNDVTGQFIIDTENGELTVTRRTVVLSSASNTKEYDGTLLYDGTVEIGGDGFIEGEGVSFNVTGSQTVTGTSANVFAYAFNEGTSADDYIITEHPGQLTVTGPQELIEITIRAASAMEPYDGSKKTVSGFENLQFEIDGHIYTAEGISAYAEGKHAGIYPSVITGTPCIRDETMNDVTGQFNIHLQNGSLQITQRSLLLTSGSAEKEYDGTDLKNPDVYIAGDGFAPNEGALFDVSGVQQIPGSRANTFTVSFRENTMASDYAVTPLPGTLTVLPKAHLYTIFLQPKSGAFRYDGNEHTVSGFETETFEIDGDTYTVEGLQASVSAKNAGTYDIFVSGTPAVRDSSGNDVTDRFNIETGTGVMTIEPREVVLISATAFKQYDGEELSDYGMTVSGDDFASGEGASYHFSGTQTMIGSSENIFGYTLLEGTEESNYRIRTVFGTLTVSDRDEQYEITLQGKSGECLYDGSEHSVSGLETESFTIGGKKYTVEGISSEITARDAGIYHTEWTGTPKVKDEKGIDVTQQFMIRCHSGILEIKRRNVILTSGSSEKEYDGTALRNPDVRISGDGFAEGEGAVFTITGRQLTAGSSDNTFIYTLYANTAPENYRITAKTGKLSVHDPAKPYAITVRANSGTVLYDGTIQELGGLESTEFMVDGKIYVLEGLGAHGAGRDAGVYDIVISGIPLIRDEAGTDVTEQFAVHTENGKLTIARRSLVLTSASAAAGYSGEPLRAGSTQVSGDGFAEGEGITFAVHGSQTVPGSSSNPFNWTFTGGALARNYDVYPVCGFLDTARRSESYVITLTSRSGEFLYDGSKKTVSGFETEEFRVGGHTYRIEGASASVSAVHAGEYFNTISGNLKVLDEKGNNVTDRFTVNTVTGRLKIRQRDVTLLSGSAEKDYDGGPLTMDTVTVGGDGFAAKEGASYTVTGSQTKIGSADNTFTYTLNKDTQASDYIFRLRRGVLSVHARSAAYEITLRAAGASFVYDGEEHSVSGLETASVQIGGHAYTAENVTASISAKDAGTYISEIKGTPRIIDENGMDVSDLFVIHTEPGILRIDPRSVTLTSASAEKNYDGQPLNAKEVIISGDGFAPGEGISYEVTGTRTEPGISLNPFTYTLNDGTDPGNYDFSETEGVLKVDDPDAKYVITLESVGGTFVYDGNVHVCDQLRSTRFSIGKETYTVSGMSAYASAVHAGTKPVEITGTPIVRDSRGNDVTDDFRIMTLPGTLTIEKRSVTLRSKDAFAVYSGEPLTMDGTETEGMGFVSGEGITFTVSGSRTLPGMAENTFAYVLNENTRAQDYKIKAEPGVLTVVTRPDTAGYEITVSGASGSFLYDGKEHSLSGMETVYGPSDEAGILAIKADGVSYTIHGLHASVSAKDAGSYAVNVTGTPSVRDENGNDVTSRFVIHTESGRMTIEKRHVILTSASVSGVYSGRELKDETVSVSGDGFAEKEGASYAFSGGRSQPGFSPNRFSYTLNPVTKAENYVITPVYGRISVISSRADYEITITAKSGEVIYDGKTHTVSGLLNTIFEADGETYTVQGLIAEGSGRDAGTYPVTVSGIPTVIDSQGKDVTNRFAVHTIDGTLKIRKRKVILTSASGSTDDTGRPFALPSVEISGNGFADGEGAYFHMPAMRILPGSAANTFTWELYDNTDAANYDIHTVYGTLHVSRPNAPWRIDLQAGSANVFYDGEEHRVEGFEREQFVVNSLPYSVSGLEAFASGIEPGIYTTVIRGDAKVTDAGGADVTDQFTVTVQNGALTIQNTYALTVNFIDEQGGVLAPAYSGYYEPGGMFGPIAAPKIDGMHAEYDSLCSDTGMPAQDVQIDLVYLPGEADGENAALVSFDELTGNVILQEITAARIPSVSASYWALANLVIALINILIAALMNLFWFLKERKQEENPSLKGVIFRSASIVTAFIGTVLFLFTEDVRRPMVTADGWTVIMAVLLVIQITIPVLNRQKKPKKTRK